MKTFSKNFTATQTGMFGMLLVLLMSFSHQGWSQRNWTVEFRPGVNFPTSELNSNTELNTGYGFEGVISYNFITQLGVYAGWGWNSFSSDQSPKTEFEETGYTYGIQYFLPFRTSDSRLFFRAGGIWNHIEMENSGGEFISDTGHGFGWQLETGISIPLTERWVIQPGFRYRSLSRDFSSGNSSIDANLNYISLGVAIGWIF